MRRFIFSVISAIAKLLPRWQETESIDVLPPLYSIPVSLPVNINELEKKFADQFIRVKTIPKQRVFVLKNVYLNSDAIVFKNLRVFLPSLPWQKDLAKYSQGRYLLKQFGGKRKEIPPHEKLALVFDYWGAKNYYHWIIEALPRLVIAQQLCPDCIVLYPEPAPAYVRTTLDLLGCKNLLPLQRNLNETWFARQLLIPERVYYVDKEDDISTNFQKGTIDKTKHRFSPEKDLKKDDIQSRELIVSVRNRLLDKLITKPVEKNKRVYVSRSNQKTRRLANEKDVTPILHRYGFEIIYFENLGFREQISLVQETEILISVHGANMVNILFMQEGAKVVELMNSNYLNDAYYNIASSAQLLYYSVACSMAAKTPEQIDDPFLFNDEDLVVDLEQLKQVLIQTTGEKNDF